MLVSGRVCGRKRVTQALLSSLSTSRIPKKPRLSPVFGVGAMHDRRGSESRVQGPTRSKIFIRAATNHDEAPFGSRVKDNAKDALGHNLSAG
jgi:hypothetical protein